MNIDYLIIGSGLTGSVIARILKDHGSSVLVVERRSHIGGNVHDHVHLSGIRINTYGPHYFRTNSQKLWSFVNRFSDFYHYEAILKTYVDNKYENWPIAESYIRRTIGENWEPSFKGEPTNFEEASLAMMPAAIYEKFVKGYTVKQWGVLTNTLSADLAGRFDVRSDDEPRLKRHKYQGLPAQGYRAFMENMLTGIPVILNYDYLKERDAIKPNRKLVFTGAIDEFFNFELGKLKYRGQKREEIYFPDTEYKQPCGQVNYPELKNGPHIRTIEWKHMMPKEYADRITGTVLTREIPFTPDDPDNYEYPFPDQENAILYNKYRSRADKLTNTIICGRLGEYRYYDMDQAIARAMLLAKGILET